jgi:hypothetical protein
VKRTTIPGGIFEAAPLLVRRLSTGIQKYPSGKFGIVGSIPIELTEPYTSGFTQGRASRVWEALQDVIDALTGLGITRFQLPDCSWYDESHATREAGGGENRPA